ncbi:MAG: quinone oxidoreductase [Deltaproteobacteria bacterium]|nr:MAG: quinone oxidoreductase [Deltaproteobacteria bacterium]
MKAQAIRIHATGGPEVLRLEDIEVGDPGPGQALVRHGAIGLNFIDTYHRTGLYPIPLPATLGLEAAGVVEAVGPGVTEVAPGDRVAYAAPPLGAYCTARLMTADRLVKLPAAVDEISAAATLLKGLTAWFLVNRTYRVKPGDTVVVSAAAGGVGLLLVQWAKHLGASVIGTVGSEAKAELARAHGCDHTILYSQEDVAARVRELTSGAGVPVVYDSVGAATFASSLECLAPMGMMVSYGNASGPPPAIAPGVLGQKGSLFLTRPSMMDYTRARADLVAGAEALFAVLESGAVEVRTISTRPLADAAAAHADLEARRTTGSTVLIP